MLWASLLFLPTSVLIASEKNKHFIKSEKQK